MADPLSVLGTAVGVASLAIQVTQSLREFYRAYKDRASEVARILERLESLQGIFQHLKNALSNRTSEEKEQSLVKSVETSITDCDGLILKLHGKYLKFRATQDASSNSKLSIKVKGLKYPFEQKTLLKLDEDIGRIQENLSFALSVFQLKDAQKIREDVAEIQAIVDSIRVQEIPRRLTDWLKAPDATIDHNAARSKKFQNTGQWLIESPAFLTWMQEENSMIWVHGLPGSGKSILCSTAIEAVWQQWQKDGHIGVAFFYFTFNDSAKKDVSSMIRPMLLQLSSQLQDGYADLEQLYASYSVGTPPSTVLLDCLRNLIMKFRHVYILVDALDESPPSGSREEDGSRKETGFREDVLDAVETLRKWELQPLHLFATSRDERDIRDGLDLSTTRQITLQNKEVADDIANFINGRLKDRKFRKLSPWGDMIRDALTKGAKGIFRWVECQLQSLQSCPCSEFHLNTILNSLPPTLDKTYERILSNIPDFQFADARRILTLLCFSLRPLTIEELIDGVAVVVTGSPGLDRTRRLQGSDDIRGICPGLVDFGQRWDRHTRTTTETVRIAHFSIQEYLESERFPQPNSLNYSVNSVAANLEIAQICLIYLLEGRLCNSSLDWPIVLEFPLARYAARYWYEHCQAMLESVPEVDCLILRVLQYEPAFTTWVKLFNADSNNLDENRWLQFELSSDRIATPIYYASLLGLDRTLSELITAEISKGESTSAPSLAPTSPVSTQIEKVVGRPKKAQQGGSFGEDDYKMHAWFRRDASRNFKIGFYHNALAAASAHGHIRAVSLLLDRGAKSNREGLRYGRALDAAVSRGHYRVAELLLERGADMNKQGGQNGNPFQRACSGGQNQIVRMLLERGADVNAKSGNQKYALHGASFGGHYQVVQMLLEKGANVNAQGGVFQRALAAACAAGHGEVVTLLLERGADINADCGRFGTALQAASAEGHYQVVRVLLEKGADVNAQGGRYQNALMAASIKGHVDVISLLLERGANVNAQGFFPYDNALHAAQNKRHDRAIDVLRRGGAIERQKTIEPRNANAVDHPLRSPVERKRKSYPKSGRTSKSSPSTHLTPEPIDYWDCSNFPGVFADLNEDDTA